jgi:DNA-binding response OmpR family regulator
MTWAGPTRIWIVDPRPADYGCLKSECETGQLEVRFLKSARDVLRQWPAESPDVCFVNVRLDGISGFDLVDMLRPFPEGVTVGIVGDRYVMEDEIRALSLGVHHYLCKPLEGALLSKLSIHSKPERSYCR